MSKTPDEIVKALKCCGANLPCDYCPYFDECACDCMSSLNNDAAALIESMQAQLAASQRRERAAVEDMLKVLLSQLEKEKDIISNEHGKDYAHLNFADGRRHTLMRVEAWAKTQIKKWRGPQDEKGDVK